jgi:RNase P protein component
MRNKIARALRKWADLIDPRNNPSSRVVCRVDIDSKDAEVNIERLKVKLQQLVDYSAQITKNASLPPQPPASIDPGIEVGF